ncbi:MAG: hypothetical protein V4757_07225 [Pseudomonadota bacterium]
MTDILARFELHSPEQAHQVIAHGAWPYVKEQTGHGRHLVMTIGLLEDDITNAQRGYLHAVVLTEIAQFARANGEQFPMSVWKEHFRSEFLGFKLVTAINPFTGRKSRRRVRVSTEDLGIKAMAEYIDRIIAFAATELGVQVSEPLPPHLRPQRRHKKDRQVDAETGEILEPAC